MMDDKQTRKFLRRQFRPLGWSLLVYYTVMNIMVVLTVMVDSAQAALKLLQSGGSAPAPEELMQSAMNNAWGYLAACAMGFVILLAWKGWDFFREEVFEKKKRMRFGTFVAIACVFLGCQVLVSLYGSALEAVLNLFGLSAMAALEAATVQSDSISMFLYASLGAPIAEELLFRGFVQRSLMPFGKKFAIFASALFFGIFHGNLIQTPYAFLVGLVLGYVTAEYSIVWAIALHMLNNMVLADLLPRILSGLSQMTQDVILGALIWILAIAGAVILIVKRKEVSAYIRGEWMDRRCLAAFFTNSGFIVLAVVMFINMLLMVTPV